MTEKIPESENSRDRHLFGPGPKRILALDGGGVRGAISVAFLKRIETLLQDRYGKDYRLANYFDLVGGTSTGAIVAGAIALGKSVDEITDFYMTLAPYAFKRQRWHIPYLQAKFDARGLRKEIDKIVGDLKLESEELMTGLCVIMKRMDTGSPWILSNNPKAPYWDNGKDKDGKAYIGNRYYKLATLVRASTAAPHFFDPERITIVEKQNQNVPPPATSAPFDKPFPIRVLRAALEKCGLRERTKFDSDTDGLFIDGGVTPHNNPSLALLLSVTTKPFKICWPTGPENLTVISVGTGTYRPRLSFESLGFARFPKLAYHALMSLMTDAETQALALMQWMGQCPAPWEINSEIGTLADDSPPGGKLLRFLRYDVRLERKWLVEQKWPASRIKTDFTDSEVEHLRSMDDPEIVEKLFDIGKLAAERQVKPEHLFGVIDRKEPLRSSAE